MNTRKLAIAITLIVSMSMLTVFLLSNELADKQYLSNRMCLKDISKALKLFPPDFRYGNERMMIMKSLDDIINFSFRSDDYKIAYNVPKDMPELVGPLKSLVSFYRNQIDIALKTLETSKVKCGEIQIVKFYSSSIVLKSSEGIVAIDFAQGPVVAGGYPPMGEPEETDVFNAGFYMTPKQRDRLAKLVDVYLITHRHFDHTDYSLARRMSKMGKKIVAPRQLMTQWNATIPGIIVPEYDSIQKIGFIEILPQFGYQYGCSDVSLDGFRYGVPALEPDENSESVRYLIKMEDIVFLQSAENHVEAYEWLKKAADKKWDIDVLLSKGQWQGERSVTKFLEDYNDSYFYVPIHEYEVTHPGGGNRTARLLKGENLNMFNQKRMMPLLWGESILITKENAKIIIN